MESFTERLNSLFKSRQTYLNNSLKSLYEKIEKFAEKTISQIKEDQSDQENRTFSLLTEIKVLEERKKEIDAKISRITSEIEKLLEDE